MSKITREKRRKKKSKSNTIVPKKVAKIAKKLCRLKKKRKKIKKSAEMSQKVQQSFWKNPPQKIIEHFPKNARKWQKVQEKLHNRAKRYNNRIVSEIGRNLQKFQKYSANVRKYKIFKEAIKKSLNGAKKRSPKSKKSVALDQNNQLKFSSKKF